MSTQPHAALEACRASKAKPTAGAAAPSAAKATPQKRKKSAGSDVAVSGRGQQQLQPQQQQGSLLPAYARGGGGGGIESLLAPALFGGLLRSAPSLLSGIGTGMGPWEGMLQQQQQRLGLPTFLACDVAESDAGYTVTADLPGVPRECITAEIDEDDRCLVITAERDVQAEEEAGGEGEGDQQQQQQQQQVAAGGAGTGGTQQLQQRDASGGGGGGGVTYHRQDRAYGMVAERIPLPDDAAIDDTTGITCKLAEGVLTIMIPKVPREALPPHEEHGRKTIAIQ